MNIAIIPARGGSKRIPRKNIKAFCGQPMIAYAIKAAQNSDLFEHVLVSTDDAEIQNIANSLGAETPFVRPAELANDFTATVPVVAHAIQACETLGWQFSNVCCIYPGVPFIEVEDLKASLAQLSESQLVQKDAIGHREWPNSVGIGIKSQTAIDRDAIFKLDGAASTREHS
jgi:CMP-N-acetylneuraminic acid synthetase